MPRSRVIKPEFWSDEKLAKLSRDARLTFIGIWTCSDDYGVSKGNTAWLKSQIFPYDESLKLSEFSKWLVEIELMGRIISFDVEDEKYYYIKHFKDHQKVDHPSKNKNPDPPENILDHYRETLAKLSRNNLVETETEYKQKQNINKAVDYPVWLNQDLWKQFKEYRKEIKSPVTKHGEKLLISDLVKLIQQGHDQTQIIEQTIKSGKWKGFYPVKNGNNQPECNEPYRKLLRRDDDCTS